MKRWGALAACALLAACARAGVPPPGAPDAVRFAIAADPATLDPLFAHADANSVELQLARLAFEPFVDVDEKGNPVPVLLARIPTVANGDLSRDGRTITYRLRKGVVWEDGEPVTAHDVVWTLGAIRDDRNPVRSRAGYDRVASAREIDAQTVRITMKTAWAPAVASLFSYGTAPQFVLPAHVLEHEPNLERAGFGAHPVGNGPYRFVSWSRGDRLRYEANPRSWRGADRAKALDIRVVPDPNANYTALRGGALDWNLVSPAQRKSLGTPDGLAWRSVPLALVAGIAINTQHPPLDDVRVRRALAAAIDREAISKKLTFGFYPVVDTAQPLTSWAHDPHVRLPAFDPAAADRAFDAAGWRRGAGGMRARNGVPLALTYVQFPESQTGQRVATFVQAALHARGVAVTIKSISNAQLFLPKAQGGALASGAFDLAYVPWPMGADPDDSALLGCAGAQNYMHWCDRDVDALESAALTEPDRQKRTAIYAKIEARAASQVPVIFLFNPSYSYAYRTALSGFFPNAFVPTWDAWRWSLKR